MLGFDSHHRCQIEFIWGCIGGGSSEQANDQRDLAKKFHMDESKEVLEERLENFKKMLEVCPEE